MRPWRKKILVILLSVFCLWLIGSLWYMHKALPVFLGYAAKTLCSGVFISGRNPQAVFRDDIAPMTSFIPWIRSAVHSREGLVTVDLAGMFRRRASFRSGCGCTLAVDAAGDQFRKKIEAQTLAKRPPNSDGLWPQGSGETLRPLPDAVDRRELAVVLESAFVKETPDKAAMTRAMVVVYDGKLIGERYAAGFHKDMALAGWSMSKSVTNALVGILVNQQRLSLDEPAPVQAWQGSADPRRVITLDQLLRMSSGLKFSEVYVPPSDVTAMLFMQRDFAAFAAGMPLVSAPEATWRYSSGTTNIIAGIIRRTVEKEYGSLNRFARLELFDRLNMHSVVMEMDPSGTFVGSSYTFATARDWARFGLLYLQEGIWQGQKILPTGWVKYSRTPTPAAPSGKYGAHFWLNAGSPGNQSGRPWPRLPRDMFYAQGFQGQYLIIIPSKHLVLVRLGCDSKPAAWDMQGFVSDLLATIHR